LIGDPYRKPTKACFDEVADIYGANGVKGIGYIEVQVHGGLKLSDVEKVMLYPGYGDYYKDLPEQLRKAGIKVEYGL
jgi:hypothetical protein